MRLAVSLDYAHPPAPQVDAVCALEDAGLDEVLVPEAYGYDAATTLGYLAARTQRVAIGPGVFPVHTRSATLIGQTLAGLDALSGGRAVLGLGTSGPGVIEGFHGVDFTAPLGTLRRVVETCRALWRRDPPPGRSLRPILGPTRPDIPIVMATLRPGGVALAAELADAWYPLFFTADPARDVWAEARANGAARRDPALGPLGTYASMHVGVGEHAAAARDDARRHLALYVGGMGPRGKNFYTETVSRMGWAAEAAAIQDHFLARRHDDAAVAVTDEMLDALTLTGSREAVAQRLAALAAAGVTTLVMRGPAAMDAPHVRLLAAMAAGI